MRSAASFKGHPIHVMLIPFPLAFLVGAFAADAISLVWPWPPLTATAGVLAGAGVVMGLVAAVPGVVDYFRTVPPDSSAKTRATRHGLANVGAVVLFALGLLVRGGVAATPSAASLGLWAVGVALLGMGGWLGGTLVYRNQIGVDHRYAGAGKWQESRVSADAGPVVELADDLAVNQMKLVHVDGQRIVLARTEDGYVAFDDRCPHRGASLAGGSMICGTVQCPWHGSQFELATGAVKAGPAGEGIQTYPVESGPAGIRIAVRGLA